MTLIYGDKAYPGSARITSRPFASYCRNRYAGNYEELELSETLLNMGEDLIGKKPPRFDIDCFPTTDYHTQYGNEEKIAKLVLTWGPEKSHISFQGMFYRQRVMNPIKLHDCLHEIASQALKNRHARLDRYSGATIPIKSHYDSPSLTKAFKGLWELMPQLDPRILEAEKLFFCSADNIWRLGYQSLENKKILESNLEWMKEENNAKRIAVMFLYSRLAQHFGESDSTSWEFALKVATDIKDTSPEIVIERLQNMPEAYFEMSMTERYGLTGAFKNIVNALIPQAGQINNPAALKKSARTIINDYNRIYRGSWARTNLETVRNAIALQMQEEAKAKPQPSDFWKKVQPTLKPPGK